MLGAILLWLSLQDEVSILVDRLGSDQIDVRGQAEERLVKLGPGTIPALEAASQSGDDELAIRAGRLLEIQKIRLHLTPALLDRFPDAEAQIRAGGPGAWRSLLWNADGDSSLSREDLEPLLLPALAGSAAGQVRWGILELGARRNLRARKADILRLGIGSTYFSIRSPVGEWIEDLASCPDGSDLLELLREDECHVLVRPYLARIAGRDLLPPLRLLLEDRDPEVRKRALLILDRLESPEIPGCLARLLQDPEPAVRQRAAATVTRRDIHECSGVVIGLLRDPDPSVRLSALRALRAFDQRHLSAKVRSLLQDREALIRQEAIQILHAWEGAAAGPYILPLLNETHPYVQDAVLNFILTEHVISAAPHYVDRLSSAESFERRRGIHALVSLGMSSDGPSIARLLGDPDPGIRCEAAAALAALGVRESIPQLREILLGSDSLVAAAAVEALVSLDAREARPELIQLLGSPDNFRRESAVGGLRGLRLHEITPDLLPLLGNEDPRVRRDALLLLEELHAREAVPGLTRLLLDDTCMFVCETSLRALAHLGAVEAVPSIARMMERTPDRRRDALHFLGVLGGEEAARTVERSLADPDAKLRALAVRTLGVLDPRGRAPAIEKALVDPDLDVRKAAALALADDPAFRSRPDFRNQLRREALAAVARSTGVTSGMLLPLNAIRSPELWSRLRETAAKASWGDSAPQAVLQLAAAAGLEVEDRTNGMLETDFDDFPCCLGKLGARTVAEALERLFAGSGCTVLLDEGRLLILTLEEARRFWDDWVLDKGNWE